MAHAAEQERRQTRSGFLGGIPLGTVAGIRIVADWSVAVIFLLVLVNLGAGVFPQWHPGWGLALNWGVALGAAVLFFVSILLHEMSHALVGRRMGIPVRRITLFIFGGMAHTEKEPPSPKAELLMAAAGPIVSIAIGVGATALGGALANVNLGQMDDPMQAMANIGPIATLLLWLGPINVLLGVFNLVPGFPLDGGRVARAIFWAITKDLTKATRWASWGGQIVAALLIAFGITNFFGGRWGQGLWLVLIGWFLFTAAKAGYQQTAVLEALKDTRVGEVMRRRLRSVSPHLPIDALVSDYLMQADQQAFPVVSEDGQLRGIVCLQDVRRVPRPEWGGHLVHEIMTPTERLHTVRPDDPASEVLRQLTESDVDQLPVVDERGALLGLIRRRDVLRWLTLQGEGAAA